MFHATKTDGSMYNLRVGGINDRFAYGDAQSMLGAYYYMSQYVEQLHSADGVQMTFFFDSLPPIEGGERTLAGRLAREMRGLTSMVWDDKYAR